MFLRAGFRWPMPEGYDHGLVASAWEASREEEEVIETWNSFPKIIMHGFAREAQSSLRMEQRVCK